MGNNKCECLKIRYFEQSAAKSRDMQGFNYLAPRKVQRLLARGTLIIVEMENNLITFMYEIYSILYNKFS